MKITWVTRSFLDYRIPVYEEVDKLSDNQLTVIYYADVVPERCQNKLRAILGDRAIGLSGEMRLTGKKSQPISKIKSKGIRIPLQPGLIKEIRRSEPDIMLSDGFFQWTYAALWLRLFKRIPHVMCYEGTPHTERNSGRIRTLYRKLSSKLIDRIACNGKLCREYVKSIGYPENKISNGNMAADFQTLSSNVESIEPKEKEKLKSDLGLNSVVYLFVGRLVEIKGVDKLLSAWKETFSKNDDVSLLVIGDGDQKAKLDSYIDQFNLKNVKLLGTIDHDTIYQYFAIANIFIIPTLQDNWSLVVPEAMSCKLPILSSKYNGCWPELVQPENGWVFDPLDENNLIDALKTSYNERNEWLEKGNVSYKLVQNFSPENVAQNIYDTCISTLPS